MLVPIQRATTSMPALPLASALATTCATPPARSGAGADARHAPSSVTVGGALMGVGRRHRSSQRGNVTAQLYASKTMALSRRMGILATLQGIPFFKWIVGRQLGAAMDFRNPNVLHSENCSNCWC